MAWDWGDFGLIEGVRKAYDRLKSAVPTSPLEYAERLSSKLEKDGLPMKVYLKKEHLSITGSVSWCFLDRLLDSPSSDSCYIQ